MEEVRNMAWLGTLIKHPYGASKGSLSTAGRFTVVAGLLLAYLDTTEGFSSHSSSHTRKQQSLFKVSISTPSYTSLTPVKLSNLPKSSSALIDNSSLTKMFSSNPSGIASSTSGTAILSWTELQEKVGITAVGTALNSEVKQRSEGKGSAHVQNTLRLFASDVEPHITLYRDHAGWCPYCEKAMLLVEEKQVPIKIGLVPMRSYGDKPREYMQKVPSGLLPAIEVNGRIITESQVIMELIDQWHTEEDGYKPMMPKEDDNVAMARYSVLARLERELFSWWCTLAFRPEGPRLGGVGINPLKALLGGGGSNDDMSSSMKGFLDCIRKVDDELLKTKGPWFFGEQDYPTMIDFIYISHVERMLASLAFWKGLDLRDAKWKLNGLNRWLEAFEKRESYLAFKSDYYTHVKDIPPQYGPGYDGGFENERRRMSCSILGSDRSWSLPLDHDDEVQPLYNGLPLPLCVLDSMDLKADADGSYKSSDQVRMAVACRMMAGWKLASNGVNVASFASRGGPGGARNIRKTFGAELADPYASPDDAIKPTVDAALRVVCAALIDTDPSVSSGFPSTNYVVQLQSVVAKDKIAGTVASLQYLRDRIGVPRDLPLASARYLRAYLNWAIDELGR